MYEHVIYIDNFRGFHHTFIPFKEVNFFVGENSTGKTSVLSLLNILSDFSFYLSCRFFNNEVELGSFDEIADSSVQEKKYFRIGLLRKITIENIDFYNALLMTYKNDDGNPILAELVYSLGHLCVKVLYKGEYMQFKECNNEIDQALDPLMYFGKFIQNVDSLKEGFIRINDKIDNLMGRKISINKSEFFNSILPTLNLLTKLDLIKTPANGIPDKAMIALPLLTESLAWVGPIRAKPEKIYSSDSLYIERTSDGKHTPHLLKVMLTGKKDSKRKGFQDLLDKFGKESGMWKNISIKNYGKSKHSPFEIDVQIMDKPIKITNVGYGVSQILPVITEFSYFFTKHTSKDKNFWLALQQPEIHLHPKAQAALGEVFFSMNEEHQAFFLIETHSEYILDRYRIRQKDSNRAHPDRKSNAQVLFFERIEKENKVHVIDIDEQGRYSEDQPESFGDFFIQEELRLLEV